MKEIYFITATNTNVGKTKASEIFLKRFASLGKKVGYLKPIETGVLTIPEDGSQLLELTKSLNKEFNVTINDVVPYQFSLSAAPFVANNAKHIDIQLIKDKITYLLNFCDLLIVEGAGGLMVPINIDYFMIDLIKDINPTKTFLIAPTHLGSINDTLLSSHALKSKDIEHQIYLNLYKDKEDFLTITYPFYKAYFDTLLFLNEGIE